MSVKEKGSGSAELERLLKAMQPMEITVGIHGEEGGARHGEDGETIAEIAEKHEFGLGVPTRSWLRGWFDSNQDLNMRAVRDFARAGVKQGRSATQVAEQLALRFAGSIQKRIARGGDFAPNSDATIAKKGSSKPLIDTGVMRSAITARVKK